MKILIAGNLSDKHLNTITKEFPVAEIEMSTDEHELQSLIKDKDLLVAWGKYISGDLVREGNKLTWIHALSTGVDAFLIPEIVNSSIILTNSRGIHQNPLSEHVFSFMLGHARRQFDFCKLKQTHTWNHLKVSELTGSTLGILGLGAVGREIAKKGKAFNMYVMAAKRHLDQRDMDNIDELVYLENLNYLLSRVDYLVLILPLTEETRQMIGEQQLQVMKQTAVLINVARGEIVDEDALYQALKHQRIAAAGLDVFKDEPLSESSPLWELSNCYITPHIGGASPYYMTRAVSLLIDNIKTYKSDKSLVTRVDKTRGY